MLEKASSELVNHLELLDFGYDQLDDETYLFLRQRTSEIKNLIHRSAQDVFEIGQKLTEVKDKLGHGSFLLWLSAEFGWSQSAAHRFMQVAREFKTVNFTNLKIASSALYLLASNSTSRVARQEALDRAKQGEVINHSEAKSIINRYKRMEKPKLHPPITVDVSAQRVDDEAPPFVAQKLKASKREDINYEQLKQRAKQLGLLPQLTDERMLIHHLIPIEAVRICTKFVDTVENMDLQLLESMEDEALKVLINKSTLLAKRAKMLLNQKRQADQNR